MTSPLASETPYFVVRDKIMNIKVVSYNINGMPANNVQKSESLHYIMDEFDPDMLLFQEAKVWGEGDFKNKMDILSPGWNIKYPEYLINSSRGYSGVVTLSKIGFNLYNTFDLKCDHKYDKYNINRINATCLYEFPNKNGDETKLMIFNVYIPNSGCDLVRMEYKEEWMSKFTELIKRYQVLGYKIMVIGDVNVVPGPEDIKNYNANHNHAAGCTDQETMFYNRFLNETNLIDVAVKLNKRSEYTFYGRFPERNKAYHAGWRLDHVWLSPDIQIKDYQVLIQCNGSDHCPIYIEVDTDGN